MAYGGSGLVAVGPGPGGEGCPESAVGPLGVLGVIVPDPGGDGLGGLMVGLRKFRALWGCWEEKLGGRTAIRDDDGFGMDRDVNGARGIFLRALGDSPFLRELIAQVASRPTEPCAASVSV